MRIPAQLIGVALLGATLADCTRYQPAPLSAADNAAELEARTLAGNPRLQDFVRATRLGQYAGPVRWDLDSLTLAALYFHPDLDIARSRLAAARAAVATARQRPNPTLNFSPLYNLNLPSPTPWTIGGVVSFVVETFGKREQRTAQAAALAEAARWDLATAGWQVRARVRGALLALWAADHRLQLAGQRAQRETELVALLEQRLAAGQASALDLARQRISRAQIELAIRDLDRAQSEARVQLATAIGVPARALDAVAISFAELDAASSPPPGLPALRRRALTGRSDIEFSLAEYRAADAALRLQIANQYPNLTIGPEYNWGQIDTSRISNQVGVPMSVELPLFHHNQGAIAEAAARRRQAAAGLTALQAQIIGQVDTAVAAWREATRTLATADALQADAERRAARVRDSFRAGALDRPTLVTAELERAVAAASRFDALVAERQALGALEDALQQPLFGAGVWPALAEQAPHEPGLAGARP